MDRHTEEPSGKSERRATPGLELVESVQACSRSLKDHLAQQRQPPPTLASCASSSSRVPPPRTSTATDELSRKLRSNFRDLGRILGRLTRGKIADVFPSNSTDHGVGGGRARQPIQKTPTSSTSSPKIAADSQGQDEDEDICEGSTEPKKARMAAPEIEEKIRAGRLAQNHGLPQIRHVVKTSHPSYKDNDVEGAGQGIRTTTIVMMIVRMMAS
ncbi:hypothetical protein KEM48_007294 [Puccinia striiformis f. sp. tritici PST-130]|nr:hypothetical protein KEM48_007294 [Puccinia striiformis f. sp. tritici PST-130]